MTTVSSPNPAELPGSLPSKKGWLQRLGPGLITGASDDDPSGIATYSQAGAQLGFAITWTMLITYPLMCVVQEISGRIGRTTGIGIAANLRKHYSLILLRPIVGALFIANTINIGADLGAMADAVKLLIGGPAIAYAIGFGTVCAILPIVMKYERYVGVLKWLTLALFAYFGTVMIVEIPWREALTGLLIPTFSSDFSFWTTLVAILGTTISPYLFFWQASQEAEDTKEDLERKPLVRAPHQGLDAINRIRTDTYIGMAFSNLVALAIMLTTAATLHVAGVFDVNSSAEAAEALRPIAGEAAFVIFALGIIGTGMLAVPVLAGSAACAVGEALRWRVGLAWAPLRAKAFYATLALAVALGATMNLTSVSPIDALYWSAVLNGVVAVPVMAMMMFISASRRIMGKFAIGRVMQIVGWTATAVMSMAVVAMGITALW
jgi:NRAMP (natural resistance-associated macrophage protein)-like metal ion transporter